MILTCPACATSYFVPDESVGPNGRRVRCQSCAHVWHATPTEEPLILTETTREVAAETHDEPSETLAETPAPELPRAFRARAEQQRRFRKAAVQGALWAGIGAVLLGLIAAAWLFRVQIVEAWPRTAAVYAALGAPVNVAGLEFEAVTARTTAHDPGKVLVSGALRNVRGREVVAPPVRVALLDARGAEVGHRVVRIDAAPILPGQVLGFAVVIPDVDGRAADVGVDFILEPAAQKAAIAPPPIEQAATRPARRPPQAEEGGLRAASPFEDAQALDSAPVQAVSAVNG